MAPKFFVFYFIKDIPQNLAKVGEILWYNEHRGREENGKTKGRAYSAKFGEG